MIKFLIVEDDEDSLDEIRTELLPALEVRHEARFASNLAEAEEQLERYRPDLILLDMVFPLAAAKQPARDAGMRVIDLAARELPATEIIALSSQDRDFAVQLLTQRRILDFLFKDMDWQEIVARVSRHMESIAGKKLAMGGAPDDASQGREFLTGDDTMKALLLRVDRVVGTESTVMIQGESGTGKEVLARWIHQRSPRRDSPFVAVNCGALDDELTRSELFGHVKGSFTGAIADQAGRFEMAHGGTLFLDEVGELSRSNQARLLRVLEERTFERVGSNTPIECDVRLITATHRDLEAMVASNEFREDLLFRIQVFPVHLPPLRERPRDIPLLAEYHMHRFARKLGRRVEGLEPATLDRLLSYHWPGNVRQLRNVIEHAVIVETSSRLSPSSLPSLQGRARSEPSTGATFRPGATYHSTLEGFEREFLTGAIQYCQGDTACTARLLEVPLRTLQRRIKELGVKS